MWRKYRSISRNKNISTAQNRQLLFHINSCVLVKYKFKGITFDYFINTTLSYEVICIYYTLLIMPECMFMYTKY